MQRYGGEQEVCRDAERCSAAGKDIRQKESGTEAENIGTDQVMISLGNQVKAAGLYLKITRSPLKSSKQENI